jgi:hypothetical protein
MRMKTVSIAILAAVVVAILAYAPYATVKPDAIWGDGQLYGTVITPTHLPDKGPKDRLYNFDMSGLTGQAAVAESKPGDRDYNGGRWQVIFLEFTDEGRQVHDPDGDLQVNFQLMSWEEVEQHIALGHLVVKSMGPSFVCPMIPQR